MKRHVWFVVGVFALFALLIAQPYRLVVVDGKSMSPTYASGQLILTKRSDSDFQRGQAVVFKHDGETLVKRIAFLPGDRILEFKFLGRWNVPQNDFIVSRLNVDHFPQRYVSIPPGEIFVMGDNAPESVDSRSFGPIPASSVMAEVVDSPRPDILKGFAGAAVQQDGGSEYAFRREPLSGRALASARAISGRAGAN